MTLVILLTVKRVSQERFLICFFLQESHGNHIEMQPGVEAATRTDGFLTMEQEIDKANEDIQVG